MKKLRILILTIKRAYLLDRLNERLALLDLNTSLRERKRISRLENACYSASEALNELRSAGKQISLLKHY
jgi:hypothetical protein